MNVEPEQRLAEALQARAGGAGVYDGYGPGSRGPDNLRAGSSAPGPGRARRRTGWVGVLVLALLGGALVGAGLALVSLLAPGWLPVLG